MTAPATRIHPVLDAALLRVCTALEQCSTPAIEALGQAATAASASQREALLDAQQFLRRQGKAVSLDFLNQLRQFEPAPAVARPATVGGTDWGELSLMDDAQVNALMATNRIGMTLSFQAEWELRDVESYLPALLPARQDQDAKHPLHPASIAKALNQACMNQALGEATRLALLDELSRALSPEMKSCYADIAELFRSRGLQAQDLKVRSNAKPASPGSGGTSNGNGNGSGGSGGNGGSTRSTSAGSGGHANSGLDFDAGAPGHRPQGRGASGSVIGQVGAQLMDLLRRLAQSTPTDIRLGSDSASVSPSAFAAGQDSLASWPTHEQTPPPNLIIAHREALREASTGKLDHMIIDVVGSMFDQILADPKVPPQMARQLARLQLPVLRVALGDASFFSSRSHPVRRFVNRLASLACAYEDFGEDPGRAFLHKVRELVQDLVQSDFDRMDVYERQLTALETFIATQTATALKAQGDLAEVAEQKEQMLRQQQAHAKQLQTRLEGIEMPGFLRDFLVQTWSQAIIRAGHLTPPDAERVTRYRQAGKDLVLSVQAKGQTAQRQAFLAGLPGLMRALSEGMDLIHWPESSRKPFFALLLPAHAESLKGQGLTPLAYNLLSKQLDGIFGLAPIADLGQLAASEDDGANDASDDGADTLPADLDIAKQLTPKEASQLGFLPESQLDWTRPVTLDIDLGAEPAVEAVDISLDGLPSAEAPEPTSGALLLDHLQLGFAYRMHTGEAWQKVRLSHMSAGRSFFIFSYGHKHQQTLTMTSRMLHRLCESGRLRAFENAYLLERATARARKQLAELGKH